MSEDEQTEMTKQELEEYLEKAFKKPSTKTKVPYMPSEDDEEDDDDEDVNGLLLGTLRFKDNKIILSETFYDLKNPIELNSFEDLRKLITKKLLKGKK
jgi:hypothetical protein